MPGQLNQTRFLIKHSGVFYGQCSEMCGDNHRFIPVVINEHTYYNYRQIQALIQTQNSTFLYVGLRLKQIKYRLALPNLEYFFWNNGSCG